MNIGTAKPSEVQLSEVKHFFINSISVEEEYNAGTYEIDALAILERLHGQNDVVILAGGSGLFIKAVCEGFDEYPDVDEAIRTDLNKQMEKEGLVSLQNKLKELDPDYYATIDLSNSRRVQRALEVCIETGKPFSTFQSGSSKERPFEVVYIGLDVEREKLYERINQRVDDMMQYGLLDEVRKLIPYKNNNALQSVGYQELFDHLDGKLDLDEAVELIKKNSRNYAKRQMTWFRGVEDIRWFSTADTLPIAKHITSVVVSS